MFEKKTADDVVAPLAEGTYTTVVRPHQLQQGDLFTEGVTMKDRPIRTVRIDAVVYGEVDYRSRRVPVLFVTGHDTRSHGKVAYTRTSWDFMEVTRIGTAGRPRMSPTFSY